MTLQGAKVNECLYPSYDEAGRLIQHAAFVQRLDGLPAAQVKWPNADNSNCTAASTMSFTCDPGQAAGAECSF